MIHQIAIKIPQATFDDLREAAATRGIPVSRLINEIIASHVQRRFEPIGVGRPKKQYLEKT